MTVKELIDKLQQFDTCLTGFEVHGQAACVKPENFDLNVGSNYARIKAKDKIWKVLDLFFNWLNMD